jgi:3-oxoacyl-[acyl-carrier-protein] synthase-1
MTRISVVASGMVTAVGSNALASYAAIHAGVSGAKEDNLWNPEGGHYLSVGRPKMPQWWEGSDMLAELAAPAVLECFGALPPEVDPRTVPILILLSPAERPHRDPDLDRTVFLELHKRLSFAPAEGSTTYGLGSAGILPALRDADRHLSSGDTSHVVVVGVDTFLRQKVINVYLEQRRVLTEENSNGFIPGEAACAVLLARTGESAGGELQIIGTGSGRERGTIGSEIPVTGEGLTQALRGALEEAGLQWAETYYWLTDQNAEHYKAKECTLAQIRLERRDQPAAIPFEIWHPIEYLGEIGSAIAPCLLGVGLAASKARHAPGPLALLSVGEENGERAALVLQWAQSR